MRFPTLASHPVPKAPMRFFARLLQLVGLVEAGYGLFIGLHEQNIAQELKFAAFGTILFLAGWLIQRYLAD